MFFFTWPKSVLNHDHCQRLLDGYNKFKTSRVDQPIQSGRDDCMETLDNTISERPLSVIDSGPLDRAADPIAMIAREIKRKTNLACMGFPQGIHVKLCFSNFF